MVTWLQRNQAEQLSEALAAALRARVDPARVVEILTSASIGAAQLWRAALDDLAKA
jgi:3-hydroxyisobutyrate dehydrogenase-like beta-hydroxyacid dehydrogenase